jgi:mannose-6-phosphate isomerase-like protein (cupin superfamily)
MPVRHLVLTLLLCVIQYDASSQDGDTKPEARVVALSDTTGHYQPILTGPPHTNSMESGLVILRPGESGSQHSTKSYEEVLIVLSGEGEMRIEAGTILRLNQNTVAYCPVNTVHSIHNVGIVPLKYVYVAAKVVP